MCSDGSLLLPIKGVKSESGAAALVGVTTLSWQVVRVSLKSNECMYVGVPVPRVAPDLATDQGCEHEMVRKG